jgi:hypothetical protein
MDEEKFHDTEHAQSFYFTARDCNLLAVALVTHVNAHSYLTGCWTETRHCSEDLLAVALVTHVNAHSCLTGCWTESITVQMESRVEFQRPTEIYTYANRQICCRCFQVFAECNYILIYPSQ